MRISQRFISLIFFILVQALNCDDQNKSADQKWSDLKGQVVDTAKSVGSGASNFLKGMGQSVGIVDKSYHYSYQVWNDTSLTVLLVQQDLANLMGAAFPKGGDNKGKIIGAFSNTGDQLYKQQLYFVIYLYADPENREMAKFIAQTTQGPIRGTTDISAQILTGLITSLISKISGGGGPFASIDKYQILYREINPWAANDDNIYFYRVYTQKGKPYGEYLGVKAPTTDFLGMFYNSATSDVQMKFTKAGISYTVTLESSTFSPLQALETPNSIRPAAGKQASLIFLNNGVQFASIPIFDQAIGNVSWNEQTKTYDPAGPMLYTYQIYNDDKNALQVTTQGLSVGRYDQPVSGKIRDINPVRCFIWRQSADQFNKIQQKESAKSNVSTDSVPFDNQAESFWISYKTADSTVQQKIEIGATGHATFIRPQIKEKESILYGVSLSTKDDTQAKKFLDRLHAGIIGQGAVYSKVGIAGSKFDLSQIAPNQNGLIADNNPLDKNSSGVTGYIIFADKFLPTGIDSSADYYYIVPPAQLRVDQLVNNLYLDDSSYAKSDKGGIVIKPELATQFTESIIKWITQYPVSASYVTNEVTQFFLQRANPALFVKGQKQLNDQGKHMLDTFINGPISIAHFPLLRQAGTDYYVFGLGTKPDSWPSA